MAWTWTGIFEIGVPKGMSPEASKIIRLTNMVAVIGALLNLAYFFLNVAIDVPFNTALHGVMVPLGLFPVLLNRLQHHRAARIAIVLTYVPFLAVLCVGMGPGESRPELFFAVAAAGLVVASPREESRAMWTGVLLTVAGFALVKIGYRTVTPMHPYPAVQDAVGRWVVEVGLFVGLVAVAYAGRAGALAAESRLLREQERSERLLLNILPAPIAEQLKREQGTIARHHAQITVLFADIVGFTALSHNLEPESVVKLLNEIFRDFDDLVVRHGGEKIKTLGDGYMVAIGLPEPREDHAGSAARLALAMRDAVAHYRGRTVMPLDIRIGLHSGPVVAGVIGKIKFSYDLWGDTVNTASRMESTSEPGRIQVTASTRTLLGEAFRCEYRGAIAVKGKGTVETWFVEGTSTTECGTPP